MKTKLVTLLLLLTAFGAHAQFRRSSDHKVYAFTNTLRSNDVFVIGRITPDTNYNYAVSNLWTLVTNTATYFATNAAGISASTATNIAAYQAFLATNNYASTATNIAAYQAFLATNNYASTVTNIAAYQAFLATNNFAPTVTQIVQYIFTTTGIVTNQFTTNVIGSPILGDVYFGDTIFGDGSGLTNINAQNVRYPTNQAVATSIDVGGKYSGFATNDNIAIAGCSNVDATGTNVSWGILCITNLAGSGAVKTITIPAEWVDVDFLNSTTIYNTNQGVLSVMVYPGLGTNFIWRGK
jgi:hypothetical protein